MSTVQKILLFAVASLIAIGFIAKAIMASNTANTSIDSSTVQASEFLQQYDSFYSSYDNKSAAGTDVMSLVSNLKNKSDGVTITVKTLANNIGVGTAGTTYSSTSCSLTTDKTDSNYINPNGRFMGTVIKNANGIVTRVLFEQES